MSAASSGQTNEQVPLTPSTQTTSTLCSLPGTQPSGSGTWITPSGGRSTGSIGAPSRSTLSAEQSQPAGVRITSTSSTPPATSQHTAGGRYKPFVDLITSDGFAVRPGKQKFRKGSLKECDILVIANALGARRMSDATAMSA